MRSLAGDLAFYDTALRQALHAQGILTVGIPRTAWPINPCLSQQEVFAMLNASGLNRTRTPSQVRVASACGYSRPVVEALLSICFVAVSGRSPTRAVMGMCCVVGYPVFVEFVAIPHACALALR